MLRTVVPGPLRRAAWQVDERAHRLQQSLFERRLGVATSGHLYLDEAGLDATDRGFYEGCQWLPVRRALRALDPGPADVFVDLGSGRGQALLIAGLLPYGRVIGVELVDELTRDAEDNVARARPRLKTAQFETVTADVLEWPVPDDLSVVFLYCPFMGEVFHSALQRIFDSYDRSPRPLHLVYSYPWEHDWLLRSGRVVVEDVRAAQWPVKPWWWRSGWALVTYRVVGAGEGGAGVPAVRRRLYRPQRALERWSAPNGHRFKLVRPGHATVYSGPPADGP